MYRIDLSIEIAAPVERVWRALCDPAEVVRWDAGVIEALDAPADYPKAGQHVRWRYRFGPYHLLHDRPREVVPDRRLRSLLVLGPYHMDETYTLSPSERGCRLDLALDLTARVPLLGGLIERLIGGPETRRGCAASLAALKRHCEASP